jgi:hypothetical protein
MDSLSLVVVLLPSLPLVAIYLVGLILSSTKLRLYRRAATLGMVGFGLLLLAQLIRASNSLMTLPDFRGSMSARELGMRFAVTGWVSTALALTGMILLLLAIFADRPKH